MNKNKYEEKLVSRFDNKVQTKNNFSEIMANVNTSQYIDPSKTDSQLYKYVVLIVCNLIFIIYCSISLIIVINSYINKDRRHDFMHEPHREMSSDTSFNQDNPDVIKNITIIVDYFDSNSDDFNGGDFDEEIEKNTY